MRDSKHDDKSDNLQLQATNLYTISAKLFAIGELIKFRGGEPSLDEERVNYGIGEIFTSLVNKLDIIKKTKVITK